MNCGFFAALSRMKYIHRWALMRNNQPENISEHSYETAVLAHGLAVMSNTYFETTFDAAQCALLALYHDTAEIYTGDLPTPVKYKNTDIRDAYYRLETAAATELESLLPEDLRAAFRPFLLPDESTPEYRLMKAADKLSALIKCEEELKQGNQEFSAARDATEAILRQNEFPVVLYFLDNYLPAYRVTLDELR